MTDAVVDYTDCDYGFRTDTSAEVTHACILLTKNPISFLYGFSAYMCILHPLLLNSCVIICRAVQRFVTVSIRLDISEEENNEKMSPSVCISV